jgi:hypothetical protein
MTAKLATVIARAPRLRLVFHMNTRRITLAESVAELAFEEFGFSSLACVTGPYRTERAT